MLQTNGLDGEITTYLTHRMSGDFFRILFQRSFPVRNRNAMLLVSAIERSSFGCEKMRLE
jgi:hypothetical protein